MNRHLAFMPATTLASLIAALPSASYALTTVDTELILSIDVSGSVTTDEYELQRTGYLNAFSLPNVRSSVLAQSGFAIAVQQWSISAFTPSIDWVNLNSDAAYDQFLADLSVMARAGSGNTNVAAGLTAATTQITSNNFDGSKLIIDISGDGIFNRGLSPQSARDAAAAAGITVNGLPFGGSSIKEFYQNNVITADGQIFPASTLADFDTAIAAKIQAETGSGGTHPSHTNVPGPLPILGLGVAYRFSEG